MYNPKIKENLIHELYRIAQAEGKTMTKLVNEYIWEGIQRYYADRGNRRQGEFDVVSKMVADSRDTGSGFRYPRVKNLHKKGV